MTPHILEYRPTCSKQLYKGKHIHEHRLCSDAMLSFSGPRGLLGYGRVKPMLWSMRVIALSSRSYEQFVGRFGFFSSSISLSNSVCVRVCACLRAYPCVTHTEVLTKTQYY